MKLWLIAVGQRMPRWVDEAYADYAKRLPADMPLLLKPIRAETRSANLSTDTVMEREAQRIEAALPPGARLIALDEHGQRLTTAALAAQLQHWQQDGRDVALIVGGADGLAPRIKQRAHGLLRLSDLTLPHGLVRVLLAEQLYRAHSLLCGHPYHRA
ncbi:23S rRNA (pseudouridine(1915)-N(3))-methyltransferase RlmH [Thiomonas sp.]|uniref:23S rRNA (pseudouridine(1915)-N(3))-methyltransferase RlmH n=1 Tax=Thiomonas sp. TaxID=2047785 RepID=UPI0026379F73|nr:23S rRNA (pseudouridine(1915)-N(3))-methyltransferase RlmH [Thiomonas sp.]